MNIRVDLNKPIKDGAEVVFRSPVDCSQITGLIVYYRENGNTASKEFAFADANGNDVGNIDHLFGENAVVKVILDLDSNMAFVQNADTNAYLERRLNSCAGAIVCEASGEVISIADASNGKLCGLTVYGKTTQNGTPSPESPVPLESAGDSGSVGVTVLGKNLWHLRNVTISQNGAIKFANPLEPGTYTLSLECTSTDTDYDTCRIGFDGGAKNGGAVNIYVTRGSRVSRTVTLYNRSTDLNFSASTSNGPAAGDTATFTNIQVEVGSIATDYEPYNVHTLTIQTPNGLNGIGEVKDVVDCASGVREHRAYKVVLDGSDDEKWQTNANNHFFIVKSDMPYPHKAESPNIRCSHFGQDTRTACVVLGGAYGIQALNTGFTSLAEWKAFLSAQSTAGNPMTVVYELETPIETPLSAEELAQYSTLHTNKPNTTVFNDAGAEMEVFYVADTKTFFMNEIGKLAAAIVNNA